MTYLEILNTSKEPFSIGLLDKLYLKEGIIAIIKDNNIRFEYEEE